MLGIKKTYRCAAIGQGDLVLVEASRAGGKWSLKRCCGAALPDSEATIKDAISGIVASSGMRGGTISLSIPDALTLSTMFDFEELPQKKHEVQEIIKWRLSRELYIKPDEYRVAHAVISKDSGVRVLAVAVKNSLLKAYEEAFSSSGFVIENICNHAVSLLNLLTEVAKDEQELAVIVCDGSLLIMFFRKGRLNFYRSCSLNEFNNSAFKQISSTFKYYMGKSPGYKPSKTYIFGGDASFAEDIKKLFTSEVVNVSTALFLNQGSAEATGINPLQIMSALGATV